MRQSICVLEVFLELLNKPKHIIRGCAAF